MKYLKLLLLLFIGIPATAQVKISEMTTTTANPTGGWIPVVLNGNNNKLDAGIFYNKLDSLYKKAGTDSIFTIKNGVNSFAFIDEGNCCADGPFIPQKTIEELKALTVNTTLYKVYYITDKGKEGMFKYDSDVTNNDDHDGVMTIVTTNLKRFRRIVEDHINAKWFGAGNGQLLSNVFPTSQAAQDFFLKFSKEQYFVSTLHYTNQSMDWFAIQCAINYCIKTDNDKLRRLYIPSGTYNLSRELIAHNWDTSTNRYRQFRLSIEGDASVFGSGTGTILNALHSNSFVLGFQGGKGCSIKNLLIQGRFIATGIEPGPSNEAKFYNLTPEQYLVKGNAASSAVCEDRVYGPYSGIAIDPFGPTYVAGSSYDIDNGAHYYYRGARNGSSGTEMANITIQNFVVGIVTSPSGFTDNNESLSIDKLYLTSLKTGIALCQDQEKTNVVKHLTAWGPIHTVIASNGAGYGAQVAGQWSFEDVDIAGRVIQFISRNDGGRFPLFIRNFFSESLGRIGQISSDVAGAFEDAEIGFYLPMELITDPTQATYQGYMAKWQIEGGGTTFKNCNIRFYRNQEWPVGIAGNFKFENCNFESVPYYSQSHMFGQPSFVNCQTTKEGAFGITGIKSTTSSAFAKNVAYGNFTLRDYVADGLSNKQQFKYSNHSPFQIVGNKSGITITTADINSSNGDISIDLPQEWWDNYYSFTRLILMYDPANDPEGYVPLGLVKDYNTNTHKLIIGGARTGLPSTSITIACMLPVITINPFIGDLVAGVDEIRNVRMDAGVNTSYGTTPADLKGKVLLLKNVQAVTSTYGNYAVIKDYNSTSKTLYLSDAAGEFSVYQSATGVYFCNGCEKEKEMKGPNYPLFPEEIMQKGSRLVLNETSTDYTAKDYRIIKTGFFNAAGAGESRQTEMVPDFNYNNHADARFYGSSDIYFTSLADANLKITARDRKRGMNVLLLINNNIVEYWYKDGVADGNLVKKHIIAPQFTTDTNADNAEVTFYYNTTLAKHRIKEGAVWTDITTGTANDLTSWLLTGNAGTVAGNFIGTADNNSLSIRTNSIERIHISAAGNIGLGIAAPQYLLDVNGTARISTLPLLTGRDEALSFDAASKQLGYIKIPNVATSKLAANISSSATTPLSSVGGLNFTVTAGSSYKFKFIVVFSTVATTTGIKLAITYPTISSEQFSASALIPNAGDANNALFAGWMTSSGDVVTSQGIQTANTKYTAIIEGTYKADLTGTVQLTFGSEINGSQVTIFSGSYVTFEKY
jgi:hypothetical protein